MNRFDIVLGHYVFYVLHHSGQSSEFYLRLSRIRQYFAPGGMFSETRFFDSEEQDYDGAREVYISLCVKHHTNNPFCDPDDTEVTI